MREFKFRTFVNSKMVPVSIINNYRYCAVAEELDFDTMTGKVKLLEDYPVEIPVMQFTGLLDKNGKEIYEGDITRVVSKLVELVTGRDTGKVSTKFYEIIWHDKIAGFTTKAQHDGHISGIGISLDHVANWHEVIGNIYETPA